MPDLSLALGLGLTHFSLAQDGTWYQRRFPYSVTQTVPSVSLSLRTEDWQAGVVYLGQVRSTALATASDADYEDGPPDWPLSRWNGWGDAYGVFAGYRLTPYLSAGAMLYTSRWRMDIPDWRHCADCEPQHLTVWHQQRMEKTLYLSGEWHGFGLTYYHRIRAGGDEWPAIFDGRALRASYSIWW